MQLRVNTQALPIATVSDLRQHLERVRLQQFSEVWLTAGDDGPSLALFVNGTQAWLMFLCDHHGDPGFHSLNPSYHGPAELLMQFQLSNGQMDEYPVAWTLALKDACDACEYFATTQGRRSPAITWEDS